MTVCSSPRKSAVRIPARSTLARIFIIAVRRVLSGIRSSPIVLGRIYAIIVGPKLKINWALSDPLFCPYQFFPLAPIGLGTDCSERRYVRSVLYEVESMWEDDFIVTVA